MGKLEEPDAIAGRVGRLGEPIRGIRLKTDDDDAVAQEEAGEREIVKVEDGAEED